MSEYLRSEKHKDIIGKRARIKKPKEYCSYLWEKQGVITEVNGMLFLAFDTYARSMSGVYLRKGSYELEEVVENEGNKKY